jgi:HSP20 family protein
MAENTRPEGARGKPQAGGAKAQGAERGMTKQDERASSIAPRDLGFGMRTNPFTLARRAFEEMDRLMAGLGFGMPVFGGVGDEVWSPQVEMLERDGKLIVRADLPGVAKDDIELEVMGQNLVIQGRRENVQEEREGSYWRTERTYGSFRRVLPLPDEIDLEDIEARFDDGVLEVSMTLPRREEKRRSIPIGGGQKPPDSGGEPEGSVH